MQRGWMEEEDYGLEKWARTRSWRSPWEMLHCLSFVLKAVGVATEGFLGKIKGFIGENKKVMIIRSVYTIKDGKGHRVIRPALT